MSHPLVSQQDILDALLAQFDDLSPQLQRCARIIIDQPHEVGVQSMRALAGEAGLNPNSFVRLAKHLGFSGYEAMRERFRDFMRGGIGSSPERARLLQQQALTTGNQALLGKMAKASLDNLERLFVEQNADTLQQAVDAMLQAKRVYVLGIGMAYPLAYSFWYLARMGFDQFVLIPRHGSLPSDDLVRAGPDDCLIAMTFQPYRTEIIQAIGQSKEQGYKTIVITDSPSATVYRQADIGLFAPTHTPQFFPSNIALTGLIETLVALMVSCGGENTAKAIDTFNQARWDADIYVDY